jgi:hypothetical protein
MTFVDPRGYILPHGFIELARAVYETVKLRFGESWTRNMTRAEEDEEARKPQSDKTSRSRRWDIAKRCLLRSFRTGELQTFILEGSTPLPLDPSYWRNWEPSWHPFWVDPMPTPDATVFLLRRAQLLKWNKPQRHAVRRRASGARIGDYIARYLSETIAAGDCPTQNGAFEKAKSDGLHPSRKSFREEYTSQATALGHPPMRGRRGKKRQI